MLLLIMIVWLLLAPISINIDSKNAKYLIKWGGLGDFALVPAKDDWYLKLKIGFWEKKFFVFDLFKKSKEKAEIKAKPKKKKKRKETSFFKSFRKIRRVLKSFDVKVCKINLDTDDYYWNALLVPVFQSVNRGSAHRIAINFQNRNDIFLVVENRLIKVLYSVLT